MEPSAVCFRFRTVNLGAASRDTQRFAHVPCATFCFVDLRSPIVMGAAAAAAAAQSTERTAVIVDIAQTVAAERQFFILNAFVLLLRDTLRLFFQAKTSYAGSP